MHDLKDYLNSINISKENLMDSNPECESQYPPYVVNRCYSGFMDTILLANEMNLNSHIDKKLQYDFYINIIRPKKRFSPWLKKEKLDSLDCIKQYYGYSDEKAKVALKLLTQQQLEFIKAKLNRGGKHER
jgi:hypothetical protein